MVMTKYYRCLNWDTCPYIKIEDNIPYGHIGNTKEEWSNGSIWQRIYRIVSEQGIVGYGRGELLDICHCSHKQCHKQCGEYDPPNKVLKCPTCGTQLQCERCGQLYCINLEHCEYCTAQDIQELLGDELNRLEVAVIFGEANYDE